MFVTLQDTDGAYEATLATMHDVLPAPMFDFLAPRGTEWDAPIVGPAVRHAAGSRTGGLRPARATRLASHGIDLPAALAGRRCAAAVARRSLRRLGLGVGRSSRRQERRRQQQLGRCRDG